MEINGKGWNLAQGMLEIGGNMSHWLVCVDYPLVILTSPVNGISDNYKKY